MAQNTDSALRDAIQSRLFEQVRKLLADRADTVLVGNKGMTPLMLAASVGSPEILDSTATID